MQKMRKREVPVEGKPVEPKRQNAGQTINAHTIHAVNNVNAHVAHIHQNNAAVAEEAAEEEEAEEAEVKAKRPRESKPHPSKSKATATRIATMFTFAMATRGVGACADNCSDGACAASGSTDHAPQAMECEEAQETAAEAMARKLREWEKTHDRKGMWVKNGKRGMVIKAICNEEDCDRPTLNQKVFKCGVHGGAKRGQSAIGAERLKKTLEAAEEAADEEEEGTGPPRRAEAGVVDGVKTMDGRPPRVYAENGAPQTNVPHVTWHTKDNKWQVSRIDEHGKEVYVGYAYPFDAAVELRRGVVDGTIGPGALVVDPVTRAVGVTKCSHCCKPFPLGHFAPMPCLINLRKFPMFVAMARALASSDATARKEAWAALSVAPIGKGHEALRTSWCAHCREAQHRSLVEGNGIKAKCYQMAQKIRKDMARKGCALCDEKRAQCFEGDHIDREGKECGQAKVTNYGYYATEYGERGPDKMWEDYLKLQVLCKNCHCMQSSHEADYGVDSTTLAEGSTARRQREYVEAKTEYNNWRKLCVGGCRWCKTRVIKGVNERMFAWLHREDGQGKTIGVSELVANSMCPETAIPMIDHVIEDECDSELGCHNCHWFYETYPRFERDKKAHEAIVNETFCVALKVFVTRRPSRRVS